MINKISVIVFIIINVHTFYQTGPTVRHSGGPSFRNQMLLQAGGLAVALNRPIPPLPHLPPHVERGYKDLDNPSGETDDKNPWGSLAKNWGKKETQQFIDYQALLKTHITGMSILILITIITRAMTCVYFLFEFFFLFFSNKFIYLFFLTFFFYFVIYDWYFLLVSFALKFDETEARIKFVSKFEKNRPRLTKIYIIMS